MSSTSIAHTPGPWRNDAPGSLLVVADTPTGEHIVAACWGHSDNLLPQGVANARLIAAAPLMLEALQTNVSYEQALLEIERFSLVLKDTGSADQFDQLAELMRAATKLGALFRQIRDAAITTALLGCAPATEAPL